MPLSEEQMEADLTALRGMVDKLQKENEELKISLTEALKCAKEQQALAHEWEHRYLEKIK